VPGQGPGGAAGDLRRPAEHESTSGARNPIESTFATMRLRLWTATTKGCLLRRMALAVAFELAKSAKHWRRLDGSERLSQLIEGARFRDGEPVQATEDQAAA
jgi:putative transposase